MRTQSSKSRRREFTPAEAAAITQVPLKQVHQYIDRELSELDVAVRGTGTRALTFAGLIAVRMVYDFPMCLAPASRAEVIKQALMHPRRKSAELEGGKVVIRVDTARSIVQAGLHALRKAEAAISSDPGIMRGEPCMKGTRIPAHVVAAIAEAEGPAEAKATYPTLSEGQIALATLYARAHPRRGRPRRLELPAKLSKFATLLRSTTVKIG
jgi:uncharacterized protein (DUF433 family)